MSANGHPSMPVSLLAWKPITKGALRGFAKIRLGQAMIIHDVALLTNNGRRWANPPSKPQMDKDGNALRDGAGKIKYVPIIEWTDKATADRFSEAVIAVVERENPGATNE